MTLLNRESTVKMRRLLLLLIALVGATVSPLPPSSLPPHPPQTAKATIVYKIKHAVVNVVHQPDQTIITYAMGVRSHFKHHRSKQKWLGGTTPPMAICAPPSSASSLSHSPFRSFNASFISCIDIWNNSLTARYNEPLQYMRSAGWPCKDERVSDTDRLTRRHVLEGYVMLPNEAVTIAIQSSFLNCRLRSTAGATATTTTTRTTAPPIEDLPIRVPNNAIMQQVQLVTSGASRTAILNASGAYVAQQMKSIEMSLSKKHKHQNKVMASLSFLESKEWQAAWMTAGGPGPPGAKQILEPAVDGIMKPVVNTVAQQLGPELAAPLCEDMAHGLNEQLPGDVAAMLEQTLAANLTNLLTDSITAKLSDSLTTSITDELGAYLDTSVTNAAQPRLHTAVHNILSETVSKTKRCAAWHNYARTWSNMVFLYLHVVLLLV